MRGLFVTGTDTGVGKTYVTAALACLLRGQGRTVRVSKPVATGAAWTGDRWLADDTRLLANAAGDDRPDEVTPWAFPEAAAPPVAARQDGVALTLGGLADAARRRAADGAVLLVEGVGGLLCPLTETETVADLAALLTLPLLIVTHCALGTLNHTLLTVEVARGRGLAVAGVVVSATRPVRGLAEETAVAELRRLLPVPLLAMVPHDAAAEALTGVDWWALAGGVIDSRER
jgi:dethiobiotin synthetase